MYEHRSRAGTSRQRQNLTCSSNRIHALKIKTLLSCSGCGRGFGSVFHHQFQKPELVSGFFTSARRTSSGGPSRICLASGAPTFPRFWPSLASLLSVFI